MEIPAGGGKWQGMTRNESQQYAYRESARARGRERPSYLLSHEFLGVQLEVLHGSLIRVRLLGETTLGNGAHPARTKAGGIRGETRYPSCCKVLRWVLFHDHVVHYEQKDIYV